MNYRAVFVVGLLITLLFLARAENDDATFGELERHPGRRIGVVAFDSARNKRIEYHGDQRFLMCSTFKVLAVAAILKRVDENKEKLDRFVRYGEKQLLEYAPVTRAHVKEGGMTLEALCAAAISQSDNTAANLLLEAIGGPKAVTDLARALGDDLTRLDRMEPELNTATTAIRRRQPQSAAIWNNCSPRIFFPKLPGFDWRVGCRRTRRGQN